MMSTPEPPQKPRGGHGGERSSAAVSSCRKPSTVCTSCVMRRFGARPASSVHIQREATFSITPVRRTQRSHGSGLLTCAASRGPTFSHWLGKTTNIAQTCVTKTCSSVQSPNLVNATLRMEVYRAYERDESSTSATPVRNSAMPPPPSCRDCATPACCMALPAVAMPTVTMRTPRICALEHRCLVNAYCTSMPITIRMLDVSTTTAGERRAKASDLSVMKRHQKVTIIAW
mmetsp:Transcript_12231/g.31452  ORF Transcript_12231/g.31452 Transcript_12231/m.31452 type:complete len:230 (+) Transcript_12231:78-767(+)